MKQPILLLIITVISISAFAQQKGYTVKISSKPQVVFIPEREKQKNEIKVQNDSLQKDLEIYVEIMQSEKFISDNVVVSMNAEIIEEEQGPAVKVVYSYSLKNDTLKFKTDDFSLGRYTLDASNAMKVTLDIMKRSIENQLSKYIDETKEINLIINGSADATPISGTLPYNGEYGNPLTEMCTIDNIQEQMSITSERGISTNKELAFIRSYTVRHFIENSIPMLIQTQNYYEHKAQVSQYKGGEYRRVTIEMIIHNAFTNLQ